jgi:hypothetical protein
MLADLIGPAHVWSRKTDHLPANQPGIAAVHRIAEHAFDHVLAKQAKEAGVFDIPKFLVLSLRRELGEVITERDDSFPIGLTRR